MKAMQSRPSAKEPLARSPASGFVSLVDVQKRARSDAKSPSLTKRMIARVFNSGSRAWRPDVAATGVIPTHLRGHDGAPLDRSLISARLRADHRAFWMRDDAVTKCYGCQATFSTFLRKHHCRMCGQIFCSSCTRFKVNGEKFGSTGEKRVCEYCIRIVREYLVRQRAPRGSSLATRTVPISIISPAVSNASTSLAGASVRKTSPSSIAANDGIPLNSDEHSPRSESDRESTAPTISSSAPRVTPMFGEGSLSASASIPREDGVPDLGERANSTGSVESEAISSFDSHWKHDGTGEGEGTGSSDAFSDGAVTGSSARTSPLARRDSSAKSSESDRRASIAEDAGEALLRLQSRSRSTSREEAALFERLHSVGSDDEEARETRNALRASQAGHGRALRSSLYENLGLATFSPEAQAAQRAAFFSEMPGDVRAQRDELRAYGRAHAKRFVRDRLRDAGVDLAVWEDIVVSLSQRAASSVQPDVRDGDSISILEYVKCKTIPTGSPGDSTYVDGVAFRQRLVHKRMRTSIERPRVLLLSRPVDFQRGMHRFTSFEQLLEQEEAYMNLQVKKIAALDPDVVLVESTVSGKAQEKLLALGIAVGVNMKQRNMARVARCTAADIMPSVQELIEPILGTAGAFEVTLHECGDELLPLMTFRGCPETLGCTVILRGNTASELKTVKRVFREAVYMFHVAQTEAQFWFELGFCLPRELAVRGHSAGSRRSVGASGKLEEPCTPASDTLAFIAGAPGRSAFALAFDADGAPMVPSVTPAIANVPRELWLDMSTAGPSRALSGAVSPSRGGAHQSGVRGPELAAAIASAVENARSGNAGDRSISLTLGVPRSDSGEVVPLADRLHVLLSSSPYRAAVLSILFNPSTEPTTAGEPGEDGHVGDGEGKVELLPQRRCHWYLPHYTKSLLEHEMLLFLYTSSKKSDKTGKQVMCLFPCLKTITFFSGNDMSVGAYLFDNCFDVSLRCLAKGCEKSPLAHEKSYVHESGQVRLRITMLHGSLPGGLSQSSDLVVWPGRASLSRARFGSPASDVLWRMSFGRFLESFFYGYLPVARAALSEGTRADGRSTPSSGKQSPGAEGTRAYTTSDSTRAISFYHRGVVAEFSVAPIRFWRPAMPRGTDAPVGAVEATLHSIMRRNVRETELCADRALANIRMLLNVVEQADSGKVLCDVIRVAREAVTSEHGVLHAAVGEALAAAQSSPTQVSVLNEVRGQLWHFLLRWKYVLGELATWTPGDHAAGPVDDSPPAAESAPQYVGREGSSPDPLGAAEQQGTERDVAVAAAPTEKRGHLHVPGAVEGSASDRRVDTAANRNSETLARDDSSGSGELSHAQDCGILVAEDVLAALRRIGIESQASGASSEAEESGASERTGSAMYGSDAGRGSGAGRSGSEASHSGLNSLSAPSSAVFTAAAFSTSSAASVSMVRDPERPVAYALGKARSVPSSSRRRGATAMLSKVNIPETYLSEDNAMLWRFDVPRGVGGILIPVIEDEPTSLIAHVLSSVPYDAELEMRRRSPARRAGHQRSASNGAPSQPQHRRTSSDAGVSEAHSMPPIRDMTRAQLAEVLRYASVSHIKFRVTTEVSPETKERISCTVFFPEQFEAVRALYCGADVDFIGSLSRCSSWRSSGGKSGSAMYKTQDERFVVKEMSRVEFESFQKYAMSYFAYFRRNMFESLATCLVKILGVYEIEIRDPQTGCDFRKHVFVMPNLFFGRRLARVFDLKGSRRHRYVKTDQPNRTLLDENFLEYIQQCPVYLRQKHKVHFTMAVFNDSLFLSKLEVMDYSLLVGFDEERSEIVVGIIDFIRKFTLDKQLESLVKSTGLMGGGRAAPTILAPNKYRDRFREAMDTYFVMVPDKFSSLEQLAGSEGGGGAAAASAESAKKGVR